MERSVLPLLHLLLLLSLCFEGIAAYSTLVQPEWEFKTSLATTTKHKHKHSGLSQAECPSACQYRCSKTAYKKPCMYYCQKCCYKCGCVPPGTSGNKQVCACYNNWKTKKGGPKCP